MIHTVVNRGLDGRIVEAYMVCDVCGASHFWGDRCINEVYGHCSPASDVKNNTKKRPWYNGKYRKVTETQLDFDGFKVNKRFWGILEAA